MSDDRIREISRTFEMMGLGDDAHRAKFRRWESDPDEDTSSRSEPGYAFRLTDSATPA